MRNIKSLLTISLVFSSLIIIFIFLDFAAFHDIWNEYVSRQMIERFAITKSITLMNSSGTTGEWTLVNISFVSRFVFFIFLLFVLTHCMRKIPGKKWISIFTLFFCLSVLCLTIFDLGAMQNIQRDYICPNVIKQFNSINTIKLPDLTSAAKDWTILNISYFSRFLFVIYLIFYLTFISKRISIADNAPAKSF
jgi:hypothetical protein